MVRNNGVLKKRGTHRMLIVGAFLIGILASSAQIVAADSWMPTSNRGSGLGQEINAYVQNRICERFSQLHISRPFITMPLFCGANTTKPYVDLSVNPTSITVGGTALLSWTSDRADSCTFQGGLNGTRPVDGSESVSPATTTTYTINCTNQKRSASDTVTLTVRPLGTQPSLAFSANPATIAFGSSTVIAWNSTGTTNCSASGGWSGSKPVSGSLSVSPATTTAYGLTCTGENGSIYGTTTVTVIPTQVPTPTLSLLSSSSTILFGATSTLTWVSTNTTSCSAGGGWSGGKALSGSVAVSPATTTLYALTCVDPSGTVSATTTVTVTPVAAVPTLNFSASPQAISLGATSTLSWSSLNTSVCVGSGGWGGSPGLSGSLIVSPATTTTYVLTCTGAGGTVHGTSTIAVSTSTALLFSRSLQSSALETADVREEGDEQEQYEVVKAEVNTEEREETEAVQGLDESVDKDDTSSLRSFRDEVQRRVRAR